MLNKAQKILEEEFQLSKASAQIFYGKIAGFYTVVVCDESANKAVVDIGVQNAAASPAVYEKLSSLADEIKIKNYSLERHAVHAEIQGSLIKPYHTALPVYLREMTAFLASNGYMSGCFETGADDGTVHFVQINGANIFLNRESYEGAIGALEEKREQIKNLKENIPLGIIGAAVGAAIGGAIWAGVGILGYYAWLSGFATIFLSFYGYKLLGKKVGKIGAAIVFLLSIAAIFAGSVFEWTWHIFKELELYYDITLFDVLPETLPIIFEDSEIMWKFLMDIGIGIGVVFVLGIPMVISMYSDESGNYSSKQY